jgi:23S rRNA (uracil1939-C5)-methyltransferase
MVVLIVKSEDFIKKQDLDAAINKIIKRYPKIVSVVLNINDKKGNTILGEKCITVYGKDTILDTLCDAKFNIGAKSFYQVNHDQCEKLYTLAIESANLTKDDVIIDAYCGIGTIGIIASKYVNKVYGVEIVDEAIKNAKANAKLNKVSNISFVCAKAEEQIKKWMNEEIKPSVVFVDPPRKGCDKVFLETIVEMNINKVVYISCDPATLARDLKYLLSNNYELKTIKVVDLFPHTSHVETIALLEKKK